MGRIRTIKPEFPQSESVGKLSRDARLLFIQLWTVVDDEGRARAASRMLASLLYPYDDDAGTLIGSWLDELERCVMVRRYVVEGNTYLEICKWLEHQKIDKPSKSRLPAFAEGSRIFVKPREVSTTDLGPRTSTKDQGGSVERASDAIAAAAAPKLNEMRATITPEAFSIASDVLAAMGEHPEGLLSVGAPLMVQGWLNGGWHRDCILTGVKMGMQSRKGATPGSLKYFEAPIARAHAQISAPVPTHQSGGSYAETNRHRPESVGAVANRLADAGISFGPKPKLIDPYRRPTLEPVSEG